MKAIVTGGAGFIGSHLVDALINRGDEVHVIDNLRSGRLENIHPQAALHIVDISSRKVKEIIVRIKPDIVFHLAAQADVTTSEQSPDIDAEINIKGTINILEACCLARAKKIIFASTSAVYGENQKDLLSEEDPAAPISCYSLSKWTAESYIRLFYRFYQLPYTILRYANVYGPRQVAKGEGGVVAIFMNRIKKGEPLKVLSNGDQTQDFIYVKDIVRANLAAINNGSGEIIHASTAETTSINQLISYLQQIHESRPKTINLVPRPAEIKHSCLDNTKAKQLLKFTPSYSIIDGLRETYEAEVLNEK
ncbi:MAG: UDP-glucose 4-epimerase [Neobacillus sp.]|nr:UDP-glucose 4-epimerase [Neobacillus sp.]